eukprot:1508493-Amphidinium_carterae.1
MPHIVMRTSSEADLCSCVHEGTRTSILRRSSAFDDSGVCRYDIRPPHISDYQAPHTSSSPLSM